MGFPQMPASISITESASDFLPDLTLSILSGLCRVLGGSYGIAASWYHMKMRAYKHNGYLHVRKKLKEESDFLRHLV